MANNLRVDDADAWKTAMDMTIPAVVTIHSAFPYPFDTDTNRCAQATGFVVDKDRGYILTNRHVVGEGPYSGRAVFLKGAAESFVEIVYVEPEHDFALVRYNVENVSGLPVKEIKLRPKIVEEGLEIRVIGNDAGQTMSILPGVISRVDCNPPDYGHNYKDALTPYLQASADVSGGSSGSPVVTKDGFAVGLVAGGYESASTDLLLPLDRPLRALQSVQSGQSIRRGTIQSIWTLEKPAECRARGLSEHIIHKHSPDGSGLLVANKILPEGPSDGRVKEGDVLLEVNGRNVTSLSEFEDFIDNAIEDDIKIRVQRSQNSLEFELSVQNFFKIAPCRLLEFAGATLQDLRFQTAMLYNVPIKGVFLPRATGSFCLDTYSDKLIDSIDHQPTPDLDAFIKITQKIPDQAKIAIKYRNLRDLHVLSHDIITVDRHWLRKPMVLRVRQDDFASWTSTYLRLVQPATSPMRKTLPPTWADESHPAIQKVAASLVQVDIWNPYGTNGASVGKTVCMGLVINATAGFVIISRSLCPSDLCTLSVIFGDSIECPAKMVYEHALNFVVIQYDSSLVDGPIQSATFSKRVLKALEKTIIYGLNRDDSVPCTVETTVMYVEPLTGNFEPSRFYQPINVDGIHLQIDYLCKNGILFDVNGDVEALWLPFLATEHIRYVGISASLFMPAIECLQQGLLPAECRMLDVEFAKVHKSAAHVFGISEETIGDFPGREFIKVSNIACGHEQQTLAPGDIILKLAGKSLTQMSDLGEMFTSESLNMTVVRNRLQVDINVPTVTTSSWQCNRVVWFLGATFESPYYPVPLCALKLYSRIFLTDRRCGSPADMYGLPLHHFLTEVNGVVTKDFDSFIGEIKKLMENKYCQLTMVSLQGVPRSFSLMPNKYFKTVEARRSERDFHNWQFQDL